MLLICAVVAPAGAQQQQSASPARPIEVTPFIALGSPGVSPFGAAISFPIASSFSIEAEVGYRRGEGRIHALSSSANLLYALPQIRRTTPYLAGGVGLAEYGAPIIGPNGAPIATQPMVRFVVNAGGGLKVPVDDSWGMRTDARWYKSFGRHGSEHWRVSHGVSFEVGR
jgi:hypothetical protein